MRVLIYGGGAVGLGLAGFILKSGNHADILSRKDTSDKLKKEGLFIKGIFGDFSFLPSQFNSYEKINEINFSKNSYDYILVCGKSNSSSKIAEELNTAKDFIPKIVLCQNGWGNAEIFADFFDKNNIYNSRIITGFSRPEKNISEITVHADDIKIGSIFKTGICNELNDLVSALSVGGIPSSLSSSIEKDLISKLLYNSVLNPIGAIFKVPYGSLGESEYTKNIIENIAKEIFDVINYTGFKTYWGNHKDFLIDFYKKMLPPTKKHESSMLQDIKAGRTTEIDALNGIIVKLGKENNIPVTVNETITNMIKFIENQRM